MLLPDLETATGSDIVPDNLRAMQAIYAAYQLDELRAFHVVERIVDLFRQGLLPLGRGEAGEALQRYWRSGDRLSDADRADVYARALGAPGGRGGVEPNREFLSLWMRFIATVAMHARERQAPVRESPATVSDAQVRRAARTLAANASAHTGRLVSAAATRLAADVRQLFEILGNREIQQAFGARDQWQLIDQISARDLGGARNTVRHRTLSEAGSRILGWLADHADELRLPAGADADADLINATETWLAASGVSDQAIEQYSQPIESPIQVSPPIALPAVVRDLLGALGLEFGSDQGAPNSDGLIAWFQGAPRTGKTLSAHLLATAIGRDVYRIDLAAVVSKYIGETEKNLATLFDEAERADAVLLIDEADALFGRRTDVKDAHDRYANLDTAWLMQRIENYRGIVIIATNLCDSSDDTFTERWWRKRMRRVRFPRSPSRA